MRYFGQSDSRIRAGPWHIVIAGFHQLKTNVGQLHDERLQPLPASHSMIRRLGDLRGGSTKPPDRFLRPAVVVARRGGETAGPPQPLRRVRTVAKRQRNIRGTVLVRLASVMGLGK